MIFKNRSSAGKKLAKKLKKYQQENVIVLALPRGGVPVGYEIAKLLASPFNVIVSRKIGAPQNPELGIGAISENNVSLMNKRIASLLNISQNQVENIIKKEKKELSRRIRLYRNNQSLPDLSGKTVILVDDGLATGVTAKAAIESIKKLKPEKIVFAAPVCARESVKQLSPDADQIVCLYTPSALQAIGIYYKNFQQVTDQEVVRLINKLSSK